MSFNFEKVIRRRPLQLLQPLRMPEITRLLRLVEHVGGGEELCYGQLVVLGGFAVACFQVFCGLEAD